MRMRRHVCPSGLELFRRPQYVDADNSVVRMSWGDRYVPGLLSAVESVLGDNGRPSSGAARRAARAAAMGLRPQCPHGHPLPEGYLDHRTVAVGLVGLTGSGKTTLLGSLIETLLRGALAPLDVAVTMDEESAARFQVELRRTLIVDRERLPLTDALAGEAITDHPYVLRLNCAGESINLLIYDASGEQLYRRHDIAEFNPHLYYTDAVMLVLSPGAIPKLERLDDQASSEAGIAEATHMVTALADVLRAGRRVRRGEVVEQVSVVVVLAKADKLMGLDEFPRETFGHVDKYIQDRSLEQLFRNVQDGSEDLVKFLNQNEGENLVVNIMNGLPRPTFHAISATGHDADLTGHYPSIEQVGVIEPLVTLLARVGFLPADGLLAR
jgi:hypothetical protein